MKLIDKIELTCTEDGHNKVWIGELYDNNTVITRWGKIGAANLQSKEFPNAGVEFLNKKSDEKYKKGYKNS
jgi:predicted DNA-binding WGR domain protein